LPARADFCGMMEDGRWYNEPEVGGDDPVSFFGSHYNFHDVSAFFCASVALENNHVSVDLWLLRKRTDIMSWVREGNVGSGKVFPYGHDNGI